MFKSLNSRIAKKYGKIAKIQNTNIEIEKSFKSFMTEQFGPVAKNISCTVVYDNKANYAVFKFTNKTAANELSLRINELKRFLDKSGLKIGRIIIQ